MKPPVATGIIGLCSSIQPRKPCTSRDRYHLYFSSIHKGKIIGLSFCHYCHCHCCCCTLKIGKSRDIGVMASTKCCQTVRNIEKTNFSFLEFLEEVQYLVYALESSSLERNGI